MEDLIFIAGYRGIYFEPPVDGDIRVVIPEESIDSRDAAVYLCRDQQRQLRDWLNEVLGERSNG